MYMDMARGVPKNNKGVKRSFCDILYDLRSYVFFGNAAAPWNLHHASLRITRALNVKIS